MAKIYIQTNYAVLICDVLDFRFSGVYVLRIVHLSANLKSR